MLKINMKNLPRILLTVGFFMLVMGCGTSYISGLQADHKNVNKRMVDVVGIYKEFEAASKVFEEKRDILYKTTLSDSYYDIFYTNDKGIKSVLDGYEKVVDDVGIRVAALDDLCNNVYYSSRDVNNKCIGYKSVYEKINNIFVTDINNYNKNIKVYNSHNKSKLEKYRTNRKYIDYNKDKKIDGKQNI